MNEYQSCMHTKPQLPLTHGWLHRFQSCRKHFHSGKTFSKKVLMVSVSAVMDIRRESIQAIPRKLHTKYLKVHKIYYRHYVSIMSIQNSLITTTKHICR